MILLEINFGDSRSAKSAIFLCKTQLETLNFELYEFLKAEIYLVNKMVKT